MGVREGSSRSDVNQLSFFFIANIYIGYCTNIKSYQFILNEANTLRASKKAALKTIKPKKGGVTDFFRQGQSTNDRGKVKIISVRA